MQLLTTCLGTALILVTAFSSAAGQAREKVKEPEQKTSATSQTGDIAIETKDAYRPDVVPDNPMIWVHLIGGRRMQVDEVIERAEGIWYKRGNISTFLERAKVARVERVSATKPLSVTDQPRGSGTWRISDAAKVESFFLNRFERSLPPGAFGQSDLHTRWGLDHRNGMDISLHPDSPEGRALISFLRTEGIPFLAFRGPIPRVATGPHIHVGNPSPRFSGRK
ncbi:MAG: hypothetical protein ND866_01250 [Pyrinomonadaceae bacterium]|nr:hypothetical protein [Pyrinomonadaceae bacterium]